MTKKKIIIISGTKGVGKTTMLTRIVEALRNHEINVTGFLAPARIIDGKRNTYDLTNIDTNVSQLLCTGEVSSDLTKIGSFYFNERTISAGEHILDNSLDKVVIVDEIGPFELKGLVWDLAFSNLVNRNQNNIIISVRSSLVNKVIEKYKLRNHIVFNVNDNIENIMMEIIDS